ncbi:MAG TPA: TonB-dependent receptor [Chitinophagaceae bacterium]|nr:TonB-dependent receptor [Chitinophagaceae bacterium]
MRYLLFTSLVICLFGINSFANSYTLNIYDSNSMPLKNTEVYVMELEKSFMTDKAGQVILEDVPPGGYSLLITRLGYSSVIKNIEFTEHSEYEIKLQQKPQEMKVVEVFGDKEKQADKLDVLTRLPLAPNAQIQSISVISDRLISDQGALTISEVARNVPGVYTFATYGNQRESMSTRGFRGIPILKNGVRVNSDFRGIGVLSDMQGVENMQILKGSAALTQGVATDIGSPGGVINIVSKTPKFDNRGNVALRIGSWQQVRPTFDVEQVLNKEETVAFRLNGAYESGKSYRPGVSNDKLYINPSMAWKPNNNTKVILELDYLNDYRTPDPGTINRGPNDTNLIYQIPYKYFPGFEEQKAKTNNLTYALRFQHDISNDFELRAAFYGSQLINDAVTTSFSQGNRYLPNLSYNERYRMIGSSFRKDINHVIQMDFIGKELRTGALKHTFMAGVDFRINNLTTQSGAMKAGHFVDKINFAQAFGHKLPNTGYQYVPPVLDGNGNVVEEGYFSESNIEIVPGDEISSNHTAFGILIQDVISYKNYGKLFLGARYSSVIGHANANDAIFTQGTAIDPNVGLMISPIKQLNIFSSFTTSTSLRGADNLDTLGNPIGSQRITQWEAGIKSEWFNKRLRINITAFKINNKNMSIPVYDAQWNETGYYMKGGNDERKGVEVEVLGRILDNLELVTGYAFIDAQYKEHLAYYPGSAPLNTPRYTANAWVKYAFQNNVLDGLSLSLGAYYIGDRPVNDYAQTVTHEGMVPGQKPFMIKSLTTLNAQAAYRYKAWGIQLIANNILNKIGYNAYRTSFINQTDPRNFAAILSFHF